MTSSRDSLHRRLRSPSNPAINHARRSWSDNGVHFTVETASYASPGLSFGTMGGTPNAGLDSFLTPQRSRTVGGALFDTAFSLLGNAINQQTMPPPRRARTMVEDVDEDVEMEDDYDSDLAYEPRSRARSNLFSRVKGKLLDSLDGRQQRARRTAYSREQSPVQRPKTRGRQRSYQTDERRPSWTEARGVPAGEDDEEDEYEEFDKRHQRPQTTRRRADSAHVKVVEALETTVRYYLSEVKRCKKQLERATRQPRVSSAYLQALVNELKTTETSLASAMRNLEIAQDNAGRGDSQRQAPHHSRPSQPRQASTRSRDSGFVDPFPEPTFNPFFQQPRATHPLFADMDDFDPFTNTIFGAFDRHFHPSASASPLDDFHAFFAMPGAGFGNAQRKRPPFTGTSTGGQRAQTSSGFAVPLFPVQLQRPPPTLLKPDEAKRLFMPYNERWSTLSPTDPNIPYPTRGLRAEALSARDTLWTPNVNARPSTWSNEAVMQANAQAFFLGAVGLSPEYSERPGTGVIQMGFNKFQASPAQAQELIDILKREKIRWHSDRLGRRNGGLGGANEALQQDERARAVFHAVCELMEVAQ